MQQMPNKTHHPARDWVIGIAIALVIVGGSILALRGWYNHNLEPVSAVTATQFFTVNRGNGVHQIATGLQQKGLIRNINAFETFVTTNDYRDRLQAGTYSLSPSMSVQTIVNKMVKGDVARNLLTILPGKRLDQVKQAFIKAGYSQAEVDQAFNPVNYAGHPALANLPSGFSLEGYLYPDSFQKQSDTPAETIIRESLDEMAKKLTPDLLNGFKTQNLTPVQAITLASIVIQETGDPLNQPQVAQVFLSRLRQNMPLQSDVTANYAADTTGAKRSVNIDSPYNTYQHTGLPPGPISNVTASSLKAVANPASTTYLYFITGDNGKMYFSHTAQEHQTAIQQYCKKGCFQ